MTASLREPGAILLLSCYELGHQPLGLAWPRAFLERAGFAPTTIDLAVEPLDETQVGRARLVAISVPRSEEHTSELQSQSNLVCRLLLEKKKKKITRCITIIRRNERHSII